MRRLFQLLASSFFQAMEEVKHNKLRTFLSLFGITIGIFCIIGVLATVGSLERNLRNEIQSLGSTTIFVDKWQYKDITNTPYWKYAKRPPPAYNEIAEIRSRSSVVGNIAFVINTRAEVEAMENVMQNVNVYGVSNEFSDVQPIEIQFGRNLNEEEFARGSAVTVTGYNVAQNLFGEPVFAINKMMVVRGQLLRIVGVINKQGSQLIEGWAFDKSVLLPYKYARTIMDEQKADPLLLVKGKEGIDNRLLTDELQGTMRAIRKLRPNEEDNFALNNISDFTNEMSKIFIYINLGGWAIGALSFVVGIFGVANIMFVTVKERTAQIGVKKALGAKNRLILAEVLLESATLCVAGGIIGLLLLLTLTPIATSILKFPIFLSPGLIATAISICIAAGVVAGLFPAIQAARLNPVEAIRK